MALSLDDANYEEIESTATFIFHVGATMNAQFGEGEGSSATGRQIENAFRYQWGFNNISRRKMSIISKDGFRYSDKQWVEVMQYELDAGRPILYMAQQQNSNAGHAFVIDGYQSNGLVHVNFGWGGYANGWYDPNQLEDPSGRKWIRKPLSFRGLEPEEDYAVNLFSKRTPVSNISHTWHGKTYIISYTSDMTTGYGLTLDEAMIHTTDITHAAIFVQWEIDQRDGHRLKISS